LFAAIHELEDLQGNDDDSDDNKHDFHWTYDTEGVCERLQGGLRSGLRDHMFDRKNPVMITPDQALPGRTDQTMPVPAKHFELKTPPMARKMPYLNLEPTSTSLEVVLIADTNKQKHNYELRNS